MIFDYCPTVGGKPQRCLYDQMREMMDSPAVAQLIARYRAGETEAKRRLPAFCFHAHFRDGKRSSRSAEPSGLVMVDLDHLDAVKLEELSARALSDEFRAATADTLLLLHVTPSGRGLRLVCKARRCAPFEDCLCIADYQRRYAALLGASEWLDGVTTDLARLSFCPARADVLLLSERLFVEDAEVTSFAEVRGDVRSLPAPSLAEDDRVQDLFHDLPLDDIFARYFALTGGLPAEGERNSRFYAAARDLRYICDFSPRTLAAHMPAVGLGADEVYAVCRSACESSRASRMPAVVGKAVEQVRAERESEQEPARGGQSEAAEGGGLPVLFRDMAGLYPPSFRHAVTLALLPVVGTLATGVRARYLDGELHSTSFLTVITAEQASGKSFARRLVGTLLHTIALEDAAARAVEQAYREELRRKRNAKEQPADPHAKIRLVPASISVAKLLQRLDNAKGEHLFSFAEELDTVIKSNRGGAWSEKSDIYRNAFDNAVYGQDYMSEVSYSATLPVYYNMLFLGTPRQTRKFFPDAENGLVSRCCFATLPDQFAAQMPRFGQLDEGARLRVDRMVEKLRAAGGEVNLDFVNKALAAWLEAHRLAALEANDRAADIFRRRAAVIGFRAALCVAPLYDSKRKLQALPKFALHVADLVLEGQMAFAGEQLNGLLGREKPRSRGRCGSVLEALPDTFSLGELSAVLSERRMSTPPKQLVYYWTRDKLIMRKETEKNVYMKCKKSQKNGTCIAKSKDNA